MRGPVFGFDVKIEDGWYEYYQVAGDTIEEAKKTLADRVNYHTGRTEFTIIGSILLGCNK